MIYPSCKSGFTVMKHYRCREWRVACRSQAQTPRKFILRWTEKRLLRTLTSSAEDSSSRLSDRPLRTLADLYNRHIQSGFEVYTVYTVWVKKSPPWSFMTFILKRLGIFYTPITRSYLRSTTNFYSIICNFDKCHIKCDHPACVSADGGHFEHDGGRA